MADPGCDPGEPVAVEQFITDVLRRAHETAEAVDDPDEARPILRVAQLFADDFVALVTAHIDEGYFAADGGIELVLLLGGASLALALTGPGRCSADGALDLPRHLRATGIRTRDSTRHSPRRQQALTRGG